MNTSSIDDDYLYLSVAKSGDKYGFLLERYMTWSGRLSLDWLIVETIDNYFFWKLGVPCCILLTAYSIYSLLLEDIVDFKISIPVISVLILLVNPSVLKDAAWWITGFYNYLLPLSLGFFCISIFYRRKSMPRWKFHLSFVGLLFSCFSEQVAILVISSFCFLVLFERKFNVLDIVLIIFATTCFFILYLAPGNYHREIASFAYFPSYEYFSFLQKLSFGVDRLFQSFWDKENLFPLFIISLLIFLRLKFDIFKSVKDFLIFVLFLSFILLYILNVHHGVYSAFPDFGVLGVNNWSGWSKYLSYFYTFAIILGIVFSIKGFKNGVFVGFLFFMSLLLTIVVGLSPTIYASGNRILFLFNMSLVFVCVQIWAELIRKLSVEKKN